MKTTRPAATLGPTRATVVAAPRGAALRTARAAFRAAAPPLGVVAGAVAIAAVPGARGSVEAFVASYPTVGFVVATGLALAFRQHRAVLALLVVATVFSAFAGATNGDGSAARYIAVVAAILAPLDLAALALLREHSTFSPTGFLRVAALAAQAALATAVWLGDGHGATVALSRPLVGDGASGSGVPALGVVAFAVAVAVITIQVVRRATPAEGSLLAALAATFLALRGDAGDQRYFLAAAVLAVGAAVVQAAAGSAFRDRLTDLPSRRAFDEDAADLTPPYAVAMVDVDHFKKVNDDHGHAVGDQVLRMVASRLREVGGGGRAYRHGGEEFAVTFPGKEPRSVVPTLERLREAIATTPFALRAPDRPKKRPNGPAPRRARPSVLTVTVSIGVAGPGSQAGSVLETVRRADEALYRAKATGRNRVAS